MRVYWKALLFAFWFLTQPLGFASSIMSAGVSQELPCVLALEQTQASDSNDAGFKSFLAYDAQLLPTLPAIRNESGIATRATCGYGYSLISPFGEVGCSRASTVDEARFLAAKTGERMAQVTSWAEKGITPDLNPGRWVQLGDATKLNFWRTGLPGPKLFLEGEAPFIRLESSRVPFANSITAEVPASSLQWPPGAEFWKGILGQRQLKP